MAAWPRFASPVPKELRAYYRACQQWYQKHGAAALAPVERPDDPLRPYQDGKIHRRKKLVSIRLDEYLLELTKEVARQHDMPYQAVVRQWVKEGLRRAIREAKDDPDPSPIYADR